jgi:hypothetical protein
MKRSILLFLILAWIAACAPLQGPGLRITPSPSPAPTTPTSDSQKLIQVSLRVRGSAQSVPEVEVGTRAVLEASFEPVIHTLLLDAGGSVRGTSSRTWENAPVRQMRACIQLEGRFCDSGDWLPYQNTLAREIQVDWLGPRQFYLYAEFLDDTGATIPSIAVYRSDAHPVTELLLTVQGKVLPDTALEKLPSPILTALAATRTVLPLSGSVLVEGGACCAGGTAGSKKTLKVDFKAASTAAKVTEMKVQVGGGCVRDAAQLRGDWEPFQNTKTYETSLGLNWIGWYISVQYRDQNGQLSPVYCDDISLEGSPPAPQP